MYVVYLWQTLKETKIETEGACAIFEALKVNSTLTKLNVTGFEFNGIHKLMMMIMNTDR